jgi:ADP-heptose:LPS heptosyltransferase
MLEHLRLDIKRIAIFRALKLGDMLCAVPALRAIRRAYPNAHISLISLASAENLARRYPHYIDEFLPFPGYPGMPEVSPDPRDVISFINDMQRMDLDLLIQMHGSGELSNPLISLFGAKKTVGFYRSGQYCPEPGLFSLYSDNKNEVHRCLSILAPLGIDIEDDALEFPLTSKDNEVLASELNKEMSFIKSYYCIHPGASSESKRWSPQNFAQVGDYLSEKGHAVVFTGSSVEEELVSRIQELMDFDSYSTAKLNLPLGPLGALLKGSLGLICNDTGVSHLGAALEVPSIVIFSETSPERWAPLNRSLHHWFIRPEVDEVITDIEKFFMNPIFSESKTPLASYWGAI